MSTRRSRKEEEWEEHHSWSREMGEDIREGDARGYTLTVRVAFTHVRRQERDGRKQDSVKFHWRGNEYICETSLDSVGMALHVVWAELSVSHF